MAGRDRPPTIWPWEGGLLPRQIPVPSAKVGSWSRELEVPRGLGRVVTGLERRRDMVEGAV